MIAQTNEIAIRYARHDDISAILAWLNAPAFLSATRLTGFSEVQSSIAKVTLRSLIDQKNCLIAVCDNIRIAAIVCRNDSAQTDDCCPVWYIPRLQFGWISRKDEILDKARKSSIGDWKNGRFASVVAPLVSENPRPNSVRPIKYSVVGRRVLVLGPVERNRISINALETRGYEVQLGLHHDEINTSGPFDFVVCSGYHLRIPESICDQLNGRIINIHAGCLPWARGIGLTLFSVLLNYPLGTSIHLIDPGLDTGDLLLEKRMHVLPTETLRTLYTQMLNNVNNLFVEFLDQLASGEATRVPQSPINPRAYSRTRTEFENVLEVCPDGYDTQLRDVETLASAMQCILAFRSHLEADFGNKMSTERAAYHFWKS